MIYIFDKDENLLEVITDYKEFKYIKKLNSDRTLSFEIEKNNNIKKYNKVGFFDKDMKFQLFFIDDLTSFKDSDSEKISVDCLADFYILGNTLIDDKRATTINDAVNKALEETDYKVGIVESFEDRNINFYHISRIKALNEIINTFKCEIDIRVEINEATGKIGNKFIDFKHRLGADTGIRFTYDTALESVEKNTLEGHFNVLWGWGKSLETEAGGFSRKLDFADINDGKKYVEDTESIKKYGRLEGIFEDSRIEDKGILLKATKERLDETKELKMSYKASIKDISKLSGYSHFKVNTGDTIVILDEEINDIIEARIIGIEENKEDENSESDIEITLGNFLLALSDDNLDDILGNLNDKIDNIPKPDIPDADIIFPDVLPRIPVVEAQGLFSSVILSWSYENKTYFTYEVFASKIRDFMPDASNRIFEGKASSHLHEVKPSETWYYRCRAKNTYDNVTDYSLQVEATTKKISDGTQYFEELAIGHALIASLDLDKATVGKLKAQFLDVYNLVVRDGNGKIALKVDDFGRICMDVTELKISSKSVETQDGALAKINDAIKDYKITVDKEFDDVNNAYVDLETEMNGAFKDGVVSQAEAKAINERLISLEKEKADVDKEYNIVHSNSSLDNTTEKINLLNTKNAYNISYTNLKNAITNGIADGKVTSSEVSTINTKTNEYKVSSANYKEAFIKAVDKIGSEKVANLESDVGNKMSLIEQKADSITQTVKTDYSTKKETTDKIDKAINNYKKVVDVEFEEVSKAHNDLTAEMNGAFKDGLISQSEAISINERLVTLEKEKEDIYKEYNTIYSNSNLNNTSEKTELLNAKSSLDIAYLELKNTILAAIEDSKIIESEITNINSKTDIYNKASATYREKFTSAIDKIGTVKANIVDSKTETLKENFTEFKQSSENLQMKIEKSGTYNLLKNSRPRLNLTRWRASFSENNSYGAISGHAGSENFEGEYFRSGIWLKGNRPPTGQEGWFILANDSLIDYKFNMNKKYTCSFYIWSEFDDEIDIQIMDGDGTYHVMYTGDRKIYGGIYNKIEFTFQPLNIGNEPEFRISFTQYAQMEVNVYVPWVNLYEGEAIHKSHIQDEKGFYQNIMTVDERGLNCEFENGNKVAMETDGFYYKTGDGQWEYHALSLVGEARIASESTRYIYLPEVFRGKRIKVICQVGQIGTGTDAISNPKPLISFWAGADDLQNNPSGYAPYFRLYGSTRLKNNDGSVAYQDKEVLITYTVLA